MRSFYKETGKEKGRRLKRIEFDILSVYSSVQDVCLAGFLAGQLIFLTGILFLLGAFLVTFVFNLGLGATDLLLKTILSEGRGGFLSLLKFILGLWPFSLGLGGMGILFGTFLQLSRRKLQPWDFFSDRRRIPGDLVVFCVIFLVLSVIKVGLTIVFVFLTFALYELWRYWYRISLGRISKFDAYRIMAEEQKRETDLQEQ